MSDDDDETRADGFKQVWTETVRNIGGELNEAPAVRLTLDGTAVRVTTLVVSLLADTGDLLRVTVHGLSHDGEHVKDDLLAGEEIPEEIAPLIPVLVKATDGQPGG